MSEGLVDHREMKALRIDDLSIEIYSYSQINCREFPSVNENNIMSCEYDAKVSFLALRVQNRVKLVAGEVGKLHS